MSELLPNFRVNSHLEQSASLLFNNEAKSKFNINVKYISTSAAAASASLARRYEFVLDGKSHEVEFIRLDETSRLYQCDVDGHRVKLSYFLDAETGLYNCFMGDNLYEFRLEEPKYVRELEGGVSSGGAGEENEAVAPMPGVVDKLNVKVGDRVKKGDPLAVMIAMKMEYVIRSNRDGTVKTVNCTVGQNVKKSHKLITLGD